MNNIYEFGGVCDVIIRCNSDRIIGNRTYKANHPYAILRDDNVNIQYRNKTSEGIATKNILSFREGLPDLVSITNVTLTDKVCNLISTKKKEKAVITKYYNAPVDRGLIYLPETPINDNIYIYHGNTLIEEWRRNEDKIGIDDSYEKVLVFYEVEVDDHSFNFDVPEYGYFSLDIIGKGNMEKKSQDIFIKFPAVSLVSVPVFNMVNGTILYAPLQFTCIHKNQEKSYYHIGD